MNTESEVDTVDVQNALPPTLDLYLPGAEQIRTWTRSVLSELGAQGAVCVRIVDRAESEQLNLQYRGRPRPTNVLSFPAELPEAVAEEPCLGDIAVCAPIVDAEAGEQPKEPENHWAHMIVHGVLHLLGYDHQTHREADAMEALEVKILERFGISNPYL